MKHFIAIVFFSLTASSLLVGCSTSNSLNQTDNSPLNANQVAQPSTQNTNGATNPSVNNVVQPVETSTSSTFFTGSTSNLSAVRPFDPTIAKAMNYTENSSAIPLMAPTKPSFPATSMTHVSAQVTAVSTSYSVNLFTTNQDLPLNSPALSSPPYTQAAQMIGSFGGTVYTSEDAAKESLYQSEEGEIAPAYVAPPNQTGTQVDLGHGVIGTTYSSPFPMVEWHEGDWTLQVWDASLPQDVQEAKKLVRYLSSHLLPETYGVFGENLAGDGNHTSAKWVFGTVVYSCFSYHSGLQAAQMAVSMRVYPSGQLQP